MDIDALRLELNERTVLSLARRLGMNPSYLYDLKAGRRGVTLPMAAAVERETGRTGIVDAAVQQRMRAA